jgi:hypothetical protein
MNLLARAGADAGAAAGAAAPSAPAAARGAGVALGKAIGMMVVRTKVRTWKSEKVVYGTTVTASRVSTCAHEGEARNALKIGLLNHQ